MVPARSQTLTAFARRRPQYAAGAEAALDAMLGGSAYRAALETLTPEEERHLLACEGHVTHLTERDLPLVEHIDVRTMVGDPATIGRRHERLSEAGVCEVMHPPSGPDVVGELRAFAAAHQGRERTR